MDQARKKSAWMNTIKHKNTKTRVAAGHVQKGPGPSKHDKRGNRGKNKFKLDYFNCGKRYHFLMIKLSWRMYNLTILFLFM